MHPGAIAVLSLFAAQIASRREQAEELRLNSSTLVVTSIEAAAADPGRVSTTVRPIPHASHLKRFFTRLPS